MSAIEHDDIWLPFVTSLPDEAKVLELVAPMAPPHSMLPGMGGKQVVAIVPLASGWDDALAAASFDAACGEFTLTEADAGDILARLHPLLAPAAELQFVLHHPESLPVMHALATGVEADYLFNRNRALTAVANLFALTADAPAATVEAAGQSLHRAVAELRQAVQSGQSQGHGAFLQAALDAIGTLLASYRAQPSPAMVSEAMEAERQLREYAAHMQAVAASAPDAAGMERIAERARTLGYTRVEFEPAMRDGALFGWLLLLHRP